MDSNVRKAELLGEPYGTANAKLRKSIIFLLMQNLGLDTCYRCGEKIAFIDDLSIEHKTPWQSAENPREAFFDLENIAFSHLKCNVGASRKKRFTEEEQRAKESIRQKAYRKTEKYKQYRREYERNRYSSDPIYHEERKNR